MRPMSSLVLVAACVSVCSPEDRAGSEDSASQSQSSTSTRELLTIPAGPTETVLASAPMGMGVHSLGKPYDANFEPLSGPSMFPDSGEPIQTPQHTMQHLVQVYQSEHEIAAHLSAWRVNASGGGAQNRRHLSYHVMQIDRVHELDDTTTMRDAPPDATWYPWRVFVGRTYEVRLEGTTSQIHGGIEADLIKYGGGIKAFADERNLRMDVRGRGLVPADDKAIFADTPEKIEQRYSQAPTAESAVVLVMWRSIPGRLGSPDKPSSAIEEVEVEVEVEVEAEAEASCLEWSFDYVEWDIPDRKQDGNRWDADSSDPDIVLTLSVDNGAPRVSPKQETGYYRWQLSSPVRARPGSVLYLSAEDRDLRRHDPVGTLEGRVGGVLDDGVVVLGHGAARVRGHCLTN